MDARRRHAVADEPAVPVAAQRRIAHAAGPHLRRARQAGEVRRHPALHGARRGGRAHRDPQPDDRRRPAAAPDDAQRHVLTGAPAPRSRPLPLAGAQHGRDRRGPAAGRQGGHARHRGLDRARGEAALLRRGVARPAAPLREPQAAHGDRPAARGRDLLAELAVHAAVVRGRPRPVRVRRARARAPARRSRSSATATPRTGVRRSRSSRRASAGTACRSRARAARSCSP